MVTNGIQVGRPQHRPIEMKDVVANESGNSKIMEIPGPNFLHSFCEGAKSLCDGVGKFLNDAYTNFPTEKVIHALKWTRGFVFCGLMLTPGVNVVALGLLLIARSVAQLANCDAPFLGVAPYRAAAEQSAGLSHRHTHK